MTPTEIFWQKFMHLNDHQAQKVLADLVLTNSDYSHRREKSIITVALEIALDQAYTTEEDIQRLYALLHSIETDPEYDYNDGGFWDFSHF